MTNDSSKVRLEACVVGVDDVAAGVGDVFDVVKVHFGGGSGGRRHHSDSSSSWGFVRSLGSQLERPFDVLILPRP